MSIEISTDSVSVASGEDSMVRLAVPGLKGISVTVVWVSPAASVMAAGSMVKMV